MLLKECGLILIILFNLKVFIIIKLMKFEHKLVNPNCLPPEETSDVSMTVNFSDPTYGPVVEENDSYLIKDDVLINTDDVLTEETSYADMTE